MAEVIPFTPPVPQQNLPPVPKQQPFSKGFSVGGALGSFALGKISALFKPQRAIGIIVADVTIEETGRDDLEITRHPVELGAQITDHAYKQPAEVTIRAGWSDSLSLPGYLKKVYASLLDLQYSRVPFTLVTGKRTYVNMLIASLSLTTDSTTENALIVTVMCRQVIVVFSRTTTVAPRAQQAQPQTTGATESAGTRQPAPVNESVLHRTFGP